MDLKSRIGEFGGQYVPETLMHAIIELEEAYEKYIKDPDFMAEYTNLLKVYSGRPTSLYHAENLSKALGIGKVYLKREDLNHTGAHKINNVVGQVLLAKKMGKTKIIAETGAGQHGVATATIAAKFGMEAIVFMGEEDVERQALNVFKMKLLGAQVVPVTSGTKTLKDATNEAMRYWVSHVDSHFYVIGSVVGPHPYPKMVRDFQRIIGDETKKQIMTQDGKLPDALIACVGGGSNAMGMFYPFIETDVKMYGVEAAGLGLNTDQHAATISKGSKGVIHGMFTYMLQDDYGQIIPVHSISAGLDYPGIGPEHAYLHESGRCDYVSATDQEAVDALVMLSQREGIIPALESAHALAYLINHADDFKGQTVVVNLSGRGDKDMHTIMGQLEEI